MATAKIRSACAASTSKLAPELPCELDLPSASLPPTDTSPNTSTQTPYSSTSSTETQSHKAELKLVKANDLSASERRELFALWKANMSVYPALDYDDARKQEEMFDPDGRYLIATSGDGLVGFASFRFDTEETRGTRDAEVIYCYELQLSPPARRKGLARRLMDELEGIGRRRGMSKAMLTCLVANTDGLRFYARQGYTPDEIDPNRIAGEEGMEEDSTYRILSKAL